MAKEYAYLVASNDQYLELKTTYPKAYFIKLDSSISINLNQDLDVFVNHVPKHINPYIGAEFARIWYRDRSNFDHTFINGYSMGNFLERRLGIFFTYLLKFYFSAEHWHKKKIAIRVPLKIPYPLKSILRIFDNFEFIDIDSSYQIDLDLMINRAKPSPLRIHWSTPIFNSIQRLFFFLNFKRKTICFSDWTYKGISNSNFIFSNSKNPLKGFYFQRPEKFKIKNKVKFKREIALENLINFSFENKISYARELSLVLLKNIEKEIADCLPIAEKGYEILLKTIKKYQPKKIILPGFLYSHYTLVLHLSKKLKIPVIVVIDGYTVRYSKYEFFLDEYGNDFLVRNFASMGTDFHSLISSKAKNKSNLVEIRAPILLHLKEKSLSQYKYDAMILLSYPNLLNIFNRWDKRFESLKELIFVLQEIGLKNIAIKVKEGSLKSQNIASLVGSDLVNIDFIDGHLHKSIHQAGLIIGQLSTALVETTYINKPYYVFEPFENGLTEQDIKDSIIDLNLVSRDCNSLRDNILKNNYFKTSPTSLESGIKIEQIASDKLFV